MDAIQDAELRGYAQNKGWKDPQDLLTGYKNLEKLVGSEKIPMPKGDDDKEGWDRVHTALGRPAKPEDYKLPVPEGMDPTFARAAEARFHELGISAKQAQALAEWNNAQIAEAQKAQELAFNQQAQRDVEALRQSWGPEAFQENIELGRKAAQQFELGPHVDKLEQALGTKATLEFLSRIGRGLTEHSFEGGKSVTGFGMTPEAAQAQLAALKSDREFTARYLNGDASARKQMDTLMKQAFPQS